jgi:transposase-like protein
MQDGTRRRRRQLSPEEKWQVFLEVTTGQLTQSDCARKWGVDLGVVIRIRKLAKDAALAAFASGRAVAQAASLLDPYAEDPLVAGLVSKMRAILDSSTPDDGDTKLEKALRRMTKLRKSDDLSPREAEHLRDASRAAQLEYLHQVSPAAAAAFEQARAAEERRFA